MRFSILIALFIFSSCAYVNILKSKSEEDKKLSGDLKYEFNDTMGSFIKLRKKGLDSSKNIVVKSVIYSPRKEDSPVEKLISISNKDIVESDLKLLKPLKSEVIYWFDGKRYKSSISIDEKNKELKVISRAKEKQWNKAKKFSIDFNGKAFCFFSQIAECAAQAGFLEKSRLKKSGAMNLTVIWDGFPFFNEQYLNNKDEVFSRGKFSYVGKETSGLHKYALNIDGQVIHYSIYRDKYLAKMFWVSQGISQTLME